MKTIGVSGVAGAGKDTFCELLSRKIPCKRTSFADLLKKEVSPWCGAQYGIDALDCSREEKEIIRPFLVFHGNLKRKITGGRYWIDNLDKAIQAGIRQGVLKDDTTLVITDVRYDEYEYDEVTWVKDKLNGCLVHLSQYTEEPDFGEGALIRKFKEPANPSEARNDPQIKSKADYIIEWEYIKDGQIEMLNKYIDDFLNWYNKHPINDTSTQ